MRPQKLRDNFSDTAQPNSQPVRGATSDVQLHAISPKGRSVVLST